MDNMIIDTSGRNRSSPRSDHSISTGVSQRTGSKQAVRPTYPHLNRLQGHTALPISENEGKSR